MSDESKEKISLENYNYQSKTNRLNSPLSIKTCKLQGITEEDLIYLTLEEYIQSHPECMNLPKEFQQERYDNFEQSRKDLIETLKEIRNDLKESLIQTEREKAKAEEYYENNALNKDEYRRQLENELKDNIRIQIEKELEKEKMKKGGRNRKEEEGLNTKRLKQSELSVKDKKNDRKLRSEIYNAKRNNLMDKKQKDYLRKEERRKKHIEEMRREINKKRNDEFEFKKNKMTLTLTQNEEKMKEKLVNFYKKKQEREERIKKREKERLDELKNKYEEDNKKKSDRLKAAIILNEQIKNKKMEEYNKKLNNFIKNQKMKEDKEKEKQLKLKAIRDLKESTVIRRKIEIKNKEKDEREKFLHKKEKLEERLKLVKEDKEKEKMVKLNKLYITQNNLRIKHIREENAKGYLLSLKLEKIDKRRQLMKEKKEKENEENAQKKKIKEEIIKDKQIMMERLRDIMQSREEFTKEEINNYVLDGVKPKIKKNYIKCFDIKDIKADEIKEKEDEYGGEEAFITSLHEN